MGIFPDTIAQGLHRNRKRVIGKNIEPFNFIGAPGMIRTCDTRIRNPVLYPLSYGGLMIFLNF